MSHREHVFSFGYPGFRTVCKFGEDPKSVKTSNAGILVKAVAEQLKKDDTYVEANLRWSYVDATEFVKQCRANGWFIKEIDSEEVFQEVCFEVRRSV